MDYYPMKAGTSKGTVSKSHLNVLLALQKKWTLVGMGSLFSRDFLFIMAAVFALIVAFGKNLKSRIFTLDSKVFSLKRESSSFLSCLPGFIRRVAAILFEMEQSLRKKPL
jgi:hypothetical protein